jgi:hypothetical protein
MEGLVDRYVYVHVYINIFTFDAFIFIYTGNDSGDNYDDVTESAFHPHLAGGGYENLKGGSSSSIPSTTTSTDL